MPARASWVPFTWLERPAHSETTELGPATLTEIIGKPASDALTGIAPSARSAEVKQYNQQQTKMSRVYLELPITMEIPINMA